MNNTPSWVQVIVVLSGVIVAVVSLAAWLDSRQRIRQAQTKDEVQTAVKQVSELLTEKLETKDNVTKLRLELAGLTAKVDALTGIVDRAYPPVKLTNVPRP